ncbi:MAG: ATP-binding protein [Actinomycetota bacterium]
MTTGIITEDGSVSRPRGVLMARLKRLLPKGMTLPDEAWVTRQRAICILLWAHALVLPLFAMIRGYTPLHGILEGAVVAVPAFAASVKGVSKLNRMIIGTLGLMISSGVTVHISGGVIEAHFHFFVMVAVVTLYQAWIPFVLAIGFVVVHHGVMGGIAPNDVYNHMPAIRDPWTWAAIHGFFILGQSAAGLAAWKFSENAQEKAVESRERELASQRIRIEEQEKSAEALHKSEETFRLLFQSNPLPMWVYDRESLAFLAVNNAAIEKYGYSRDEFLGMTIKDIRPIEEVPALLNNLEADRSGYQDSGAWRHLTKDGRYLTVDITSHLISFEDRTSVLVVAQDVTDRKVLEESLRQSQKMEAVGQLAGGIAHDFNNLLSVVINYARLVEEELEADDPKRADVETILDAGDRGARLTRQLLTFSRKEVVQPQVSNLNDIVAGMEQLLQRTIRENITLTTHLAGDPWRVNVDWGQMEQILMNLAVNAKDAMPKGGSLLLETVNVRVDAAFARLHPGLDPGDYCCLSISDTGEGIPKELQKRIFEPFFTTKPKGEGSGLGLATVYGIVTQSGGHLSVYSEVDVGTTFKVYFPRFDAERPEDELQSESAAPSLGAGERVLVVEDEKAVRDLVVRLLSRNGYAVMDACSAAEAIELMKGVTPGHVDLLLTDVIMPGMAGRELAERLGLPTLFMSGYTDEIISQNGVLDGSEMLLQKPFSETDLIQAVRDTLAGKMASVPVV